MLAWTEPRPSKRQAASLLRSMPPNGLGREQRRSLCRDAWIPRSQSVHPFRDKRRRPVGLILLAATSRSADSLHHPPRSRGLPARLTEAACFWCRDLGHRQRTSNRDKCSDWPGGGVSGEVLHGEERDKDRCRLGFHRFGGPEVRGMSNEVCLLAPPRAPNGRAPAVWLRQARLTAQSFPAARIWARTSSTLNLAGF